MCAHMTGFQVFSPGKVIFAGVGVLLLVRIHLHSDYRNAYISQAAKNVRASHDSLIDIFERIENFIRRLEMYTEVPPTTEMMDIIMKVMVEVLCILAIATKEIKQTRASEHLQ